jgi:excisionase family DNA binding protein
MPSIVSIYAELTTQQAADFLSISRSHLIKLLESDELAYERVGVHRRIRADDVIRYKRAQDKKTRQAVADLTALGQELLISSF